MKKQIIKKSAIKRINIAKQKRVYCKKSIRESVINLNDNLEIINNEGGYPWKLL